MTRLLIILTMILAPVKWVYVVDPGICNGCGNCLYICPENAISMVAGNAYIDPELCDGCGSCVNYCPRGAIYREWYTGIEGDESGTGRLLPGVNPVIGGVLSVTGAEPSGQIVVLDLSGRRVISAVSDGSGAAEMDISTVSPGVYLMVSGNRTAMVTIRGSI